MKLYEHKVGRHTMRCQTEDAETAKEMFDQFVPNVLFHLFKLKGFDPETTELPKINGAGFYYKEKTFTVFADNDHLLILDDKGVMEMAGRIEKISDPS